MKIKSLPKSERPVEKLITSGVTTLSNAELIAVLLGTGTKEESAIGLGEAVISADESGITYLADCTPEELMKINGIGCSKAAKIVAAVELGKRISTAPKGLKPKITCSEDIANLYMEDMRYAKREMFKCLLLNMRGEVMCSENISIGELGSATVHPREAFVPAVKKSAAGVVFVHNHPSGDPTPSNEDIEVTQRLVECGELMGIEVVDHIVIGDGKYISMQSFGYINRSATAKG